MAKNWTVAEAMKALIEGDEEVFQIGKSYPKVLVALVGAKANEDAVNILTHLPERATVRVVNDLMTNGEDVEDSDEDFDEEEEVAEKKTAKRGRKPSTDSDEERKAKAKARREARKAKAKAEAEKETEEEDDSDEDSVDYSEMSAKELYQLCKKRGLNPEQKKSPSVYIKMLEEADSDDDSDDEDDWGEEEVKEKKTKSNKKSKDEEEDDEWDI